MAHLQPHSSGGDGRPPGKIRLTGIRAFTPKTVRLTGREVREIWAKHFEEREPDHPYWLYTHIPFCPQICSFCQCSTSLRKSDEQVAAYLDWLEGEIEFFAEASQPGLVHFQYVGGGTPNLLSEPQLERVLGTVDRHFRFASTSRRTFEFLPSSLRPGTLPLVRAHGFNRLTCGVQSWSDQTLKSVNRSRAGLDELGRTIEEAYGLGFDEINVDLIFGIGGESPQGFLEGLLELLARNPTTVTIHNIIPTTTNPVFSSVQEELAAHAAFEALRESIGDAVATRFPALEWVLRPNCWVLVDRRFRQGSKFSYWYFSDNERLHIDMLSVGRFAHSNILGRVFYENLSYAERYDPDEATYSAFLKTPVIDAALDAITDLVGDRSSDLVPIGARYGRRSVEMLELALERLEREGLVRRRDQRWEPVHTDGVFIDPFLPLLETALEGVPAPWSAPGTRDVERGIAVSRGARSLLVFIERIRPEGRYFARMGKLGIYYRDTSEAPVRDDDGLAEQLMRTVVEDVRQLVEQTPNVGPKEATARLQARYRQAAPVRF
jgi:coproporphyrinogen III oxidase-like Fe-S oxidoreductase